MQTLKYELEAGVGTITLNRPDVKNAIDATMARELGDLLSQLRQDDALRVLVLTGAGSSFCAGGDVRAMAGKTERTLEERLEGFKPFQRIASELLAMDRPVVAAVDGVAFGAGMSLLLMADIVVLSQRARLCMVFQRVGLIPDLAALYTLPRAVGLQRAKELIFSAREFGAEEARELGLVMEVVAADELAARAAEIARSLAGASPTAVGLVKKALRSSLNADLETMLALEAGAQAVAGSSAYAREAVRRFAVREPAQFRWAERRKD